MVIATHKKLKPILTLCIIAVVICSLLGTAGCQHSLDFRRGDPTYEKPNEFRPQFGPPEGWDPTTGEIVE